MNYIIGYDLWDEKCDVHYGIPQELTRDRKESRFAAITSAQLAFYDNGLSSVFIVSNEDDAGDHKVA